MRVISLISSATEIICALDCESMLVGRSHECDYPSSIKHLPVCTEPKFDVSGSSAEIDRLVKESLKDSLAVYRVFTDVLEKLQPDVIITQSQCDVCAVSLKDVEEAIGCMVSSKPKIVSLNPNSLNDIWIDIQNVAEALGVPERGQSLIDSMKERFRETSMRANSWGKKPYVACIEWIDPLMAAGNWMPEFVELAGGINLFGEAGKHSPWMTWEQLVESNPDVILVCSCGFDLERTRNEMKYLTKKPEWNHLRAVQYGRVWIADGNAYFNRPGPRLVESIEMLAEAIQPAAFLFGHDGIEVYQE